MDHGKASPGRACAPASPAQPKPRPPTAGTDERRVQDHADVGIDMRLRRVLPGKTCFRLTMGIWVSTRPLSSTDGEGDVETSLITHWTCDVVCELQVPSAHRRRLRALGTLSDARHARDSLDRTCASIRPGETALRLGAFVGVPPSSSAALDAGLSELLAAGTPSRSLRKRARTGCRRRQSTGWSTGRTGWLWCPPRVSTRRLRRGRLPTRPHGDASQL